MSENIKPCPFCGGPAKEVFGAIHLVMHSALIGAEFVCPARGVTLLSLWNTRVEPQSPPFISSSQRDKPLLEELYGKKT